MSNNMSNNMPKTKTKDSSKKLKENVEQNSESFAFSNLSKTLTKEITKGEKKKNGIFFTPPNTVHDNITYLKPFIEDNIKTVLEPSCGSCEYILKLDKTCSGLDITGIEFNKTIFDSINKYNSSNIKIIHDNFLTHGFDRKFDLIIGNPPYFVMKKSEVEKEYYKYFEGRPNIFILFIIKSLKLLNKNGIISFVLPKNFLNCLYYDKTRNFINKNYSILNIIECNDTYLETQQDTIILIIKNTKEKNISNKQFTLSISDFTIFGTKSNIKKLNELYKDSNTLYDLGYEVKVGTVVWNQCKSLLTNDNSKTRLIYSSDIVDNKLSIKKYQNEDKKNYIAKKGITDTLLVINRGYGNGAYNFNYCIINEKGKIDYLIENHLICIKFKDKLSKKKLIQNYKNIIKSFNNEKTKSFIRLYFGTNAMNTTELCRILPIYSNL